MTVGKASEELGPPIPIGRTRSPRRTRHNRGDRRLAHNLPEPRSRFVGRGRELDKLARLTERTRLITLIGAPGVGKSRLGLELAWCVAGRDAHEVALVDLAPLTDGNLVGAAAASALSVTEVPGQSLADTLMAHIGQRQLLVVIDNCEHLIAAVARLADSLLRACPALRIVATSREPMRIDGETVWQVPPLSTPSRAEQPDPDVMLDYESVALFVDRARASMPAFRFDATVAAPVGEICRRLDGIPLALELAAARVEVLTPAEIARRLDERFSLLSTPRRSELPRHQTLRAALDWSHDQLSASERAVLRRLAVFTGGFCLEAAESVCPHPAVDGGEILEVLAALVARSLLVAETNSGSPRARYRLLETIRAYAGDWLDRAGEETTLGEAHARFFLSLAERAEPALTGPEQDHWLERLEAERANLRAALEWSLANGRGEWALRLAGALVLFWRVRCHFSDGRNLLEAALSSGLGAPAALEAKALWGLGFMTMMAGDSDAAVTSLERSVVRFREIADGRGCGRALMILANATQGSTNPKALLDESMALAREAGDLWCLAHALGLAGLHHRTHNELTAARPLFEDCLAVARHAEDKQSLRFGLFGLGSVCVSQGDYVTAEPLLKEAAGVTRELGENYGEATALQYLGVLYFGRGDYALAHETLTRAVELIPDASPFGTVSALLVLLARVHHAEGDRAAALRLYQEVLTSTPPGMSLRIPALQGSAELALEEGRLSVAHLLDEALAVAREGGDNGSVAEVLHTLGWLARVGGHTQLASRHHLEALRLQHQIGNAPGIATTLEALAGLALAAGRDVHATRLLGAAGALRDKGGYARPPWESARYEPTIRLARDRLGAKELQAAITQGAQLSVDEAVAQASKGRGPRRRPASGWASLTATEGQVAALAADGLTNPEIGERLFITLATVKNHLSSIFVKLGISRRSELMKEVWRRQPQQ